MGKLSPDQEAFRLQRVREAFAKMGPRSEEWRKRASEGIKRAWREGKMKPLSPESRKKVSDANRGKKRDPEMMERIRQGNIGRKRSPEVIQKMREARIGIDPMRNMTSEQRAEVTRKSKEAKKANGWTPSDEQRRNQSLKMRGIKWSEEIIEKRAEPMRGREQKAEATKKGPTNKSSLIGVLRDSCGRVWRFRNLSHFVRTHEFLFMPDDLAAKPSGGKRGNTCNAIKRLLALFGHGKVVPGSWKGWTAVALLEELDGAKDLLGRDESTPPDQEQE